MCLSVSVCLSQVWVQSKRLDESNRVYRGYAPLVRHCVVRESWYLWNKALVYFPMELSFKLWTQPIFCLFSPRYVDRTNCCQLSSTEDRGQFITLSVHLCLFHRRIRAACVYNGSLAWYSVVLTPRIRSTVKYNQLDWSKLTTYVTSAAR